VTKEIRFADWSMREEITALWLSCFAERREAVDLFFAYHFHPKDTLVLKVNECIVAMVHMLPGEILTETGRLQAHYIYAAATDKALRGQGLMGELMARSAAEGAARGDHYAFLLPADPGLYDFYAKHGFGKFFKTAFCEMSRRELENASCAPGRVAPAVDVTPSALKETRDRFVAVSPGSAVWSEQAIDYAVRVTKLYGGQLVTARFNGRLAYALCSRVHAGQCEVLEFGASPYDEAALCVAVLDSVPAEHFRFRLPARRTLLGRTGQPVDFGMIKPLTPPAALSLQFMACSTPYLGLTLD
jgi:GNAT superfamily N-acetyltransferase